MELIVPFEQEIDILKEVKASNFVSKDFIVYEDGSIYFGRIVDGYRDGVGFWLSPNNDMIYYGDWKEGIREGFGIMSISEGEYVYEGYFEEDTRKGYGHEMCDFKNNDSKMIYRGIFSNDDKNGAGYLEVHPKQLPYYETYDGKFVNGVRSGFGRQSFIFEDHTQNIFYGHFLNNLRNGSGVLYFNDGGFFVGTWLNDLKEGRCTNYLSDGTVVTQLWKKDLPSTSVSDDQRMFKFDLSNINGMKDYLKEEIDMILKSHLLKLVNWFNTYSELKAVGPLKKAHVEAIKTTVQKMYDSFQQFNDDLEVLSVVSDMETARTGIVSESEYGSFVDSTKINSGVNTYDENGNTISESNIESKTEADNENNIFDDTSEVAEFESAFVTYPMRIHSEGTTQGTISFHRLLLLFIETGIHALLPEGVCTIVKELYSMDLGCFQISKILRQPPMLMIDSEIRFFEFLFLLIKLSFYVSRHLHPLTLSKQLLFLFSLLFPNCPTGTMEKRAETMNKELATHVEAILRLNGEVGMVFTQKLDVPLFDELFNAHGEEISEFYSSLSLKTSRNDIKHTNVSKYDVYPTLMDCFALFNEVGLFEDVKGVPHVGYNELFHTLNVSSNYLYKCVSIFEFVFLLVSISTQLFKNSNPYKFSTYEQCYIVLQVVFGKEQSNILTELRLNPTKIKQLKDEAASSIQGGWRVYQAKLKFQEYKIEREKHLLEQARAKSSKGKNKSKKGKKK
eukprot:TRINITY_DN2824_c0_g1_i1.p1 TRINITY_DN2824_c0_g1~~TRINITY_DN2824_c0_g1_i1.p1  ORF type:complete len:732 (+),score=202.33 TRINITY_DN2824_c0_g1_i1:26-2221(+)